MNNKFCVIGITGKNGAGKGTAVDCLIAYYGAEQFSVSGLIEEEGRRMGIPIKDRNAFRLLANSLRKECGPEYFVRILADRAVFQKKGFFIIESLRCQGEVEYLSNRFKEQFVLIGVDASMDTRYSRAFRRGTIKDRTSFEEFERLERLESEGSDKWTQNLSMCMKMVAPSFFILNEFDMGYFRRRVEEIAREIGMKRKRRQ